MFAWLKNVGLHITDWLGDGLGTFFNWLLGGIAEVLTKVIDAAGGLWDLLDAIWGLFIGFKDLILELFLLFFPFIPPAVSAVISMGMFAGVIFGVVKLIQKVRG